MQNQFRGQTFRRYNRYRFRRFRLPSRRPVRHGVPPVFTASGGAGSMLWMATEADAGPMIEPTGSAGSAYVFDFAFVKKKKICFVLVVVGRAVAHTDPRASPSV